MSDAPERTSDAPDAQVELAARMARPQRHRLLQGYPPLPLMRPAPQRRRGGATPADDDDAERWVDVDRSRPLIVGVLPHHMCTPRVHGCGFCTFPHERHDVRFRRRVTGEVAHDAAVLLRDKRRDQGFDPRDDTLRGRRVDAVYFGGATANLAKPEELRAIFDAIAAGLDVGGAEVTLEGVPSLFLSLLGSPLAWLASLPTRHKRVSMGVQTFDRTQIARMGREAFGDAKTVTSVVKKAHARGMTASGDFLFNLPHQTLAEMLDDVKRAVDIGLDQICVYHLVLYEGLGTPWSRDPALVAAVPKNAQASESWLAVRDALLASGYVQTTLTNFEKADVRGGGKRFVYEEASFTPETYDAVGIGPAAISGFVDIARKRAIKTVNGKRVGERLGKDGGDLWFPLDEQDLRLLCVTRWLSKLEVVRASYASLFGADVVDEHGDAIAACVTAGLVVVDARAVALTPLGMFYADAVAGTIAAHRAAHVRGAAAGKRTMQLAEEMTRVPVFMG